MNYQKTIYNKSFGNYMIRCYSWYFWLWKGQSQALEMRGVKRMLTVPLLGARWFHFGKEYLLFGAARIQCLG
jgi:hypothetical protein